MGRSGFAVAIAQAQHSSWSLEAGRAHAPPCRARNGTGGFRGMFVLAGRAMQLLVRCRGSSRQQVLSPTSRGWFRKTARDAVEAVKFGRFVVLGEG